MTHEQDYQAGILAERSRQAFQSWLESPKKWGSWDSFATITFMRKERYPEHAIQKSMAHLVSFFPYGFIGAEEHYLGGWHCHALLSTGITQKGHYATPEAHIEAIDNLCYLDLNQVGKFRRVAPISNLGGVTGYITKYITKELAGWNIWGWI